MSCDILAKNINEATRLWCGDVRMDVMNTHMDTGGGYSHSRYCLHESVFDGHKIKYNKTENSKNTMEKHSKIEQNKDTVEKHINECPEIGVSTPPGCMMEPTINNIWVPNQNNGDKKKMVTI